MGALPYIKETVPRGVVHASVLLRDDVAGRQEAAGAGLAVRALVVPDLRRDASAAARSPRMPSPSPSAAHADGRVQWSSTITVRLGRQPTRSNPPANTGVNPETAFGRSAAAIPSLDWRTVVSPRTRRPPSAPRLRRRDDAQPLERWTLSESCRGIAVAMLSTAAIRSRSCHSSFAQRQGSPTLADRRRACVVDRLRAKTQIHAAAV